MCVGALHSFAGLDAQIRGLCSSWQWQPEDRILHTLPLHHIHGIVNAAFCPLAVGACVEFQPNFSPTNVWEALKVRHQLTYTMLQSSSLQTKLAVAEEEEEYPMNHSYLRFEWLGHFHKVAYTV